MSQPHRPQQDNFGAQSYSPAPVPFNLTLPPNMNVPNGTSEHTNGNNNAGPSNLPANPADSVNGNGNFDQAALQARIALAQQMAQQNMQQQSQHEQQFQNPQQGQIPERRPSVLPPDWSQLAQTGAGGIMNGAQGATREALMKQVSCSAVDTATEPQLTYSYKLYSHHMRLLRGIDWVALLEPDNLHQLLHQV